MLNISNFIIFCYFYLNKMNTIFQQECIKLIKGDG